MGKIYCVMGKSSSGKDSIYSRIMQQGNPALLRIVPYTTRPRGGNHRGADIRLPPQGGRDGWTGICVYG